MSNTRAVKRSAKRPAPLHVVAGALTQTDGRILIAQRPPGKRQAGRWEFPGGKLEVGETRIQGLARELQEELGISVVGHPRPLLRVRHAYEFGDVIIDMWVVPHYAGEPRGLDGQQLRWCTLAELEQSTAELLPADLPIVRALRLPERLTQASSPFYAVGAMEAMGAERRLKGVLYADVSAGRGSGSGPAAGLSAADFVVLEGVVANAELAALCEAVAVPVYARGLALQTAWELGATGISELLG